MKPNEINVYSSAGGIGDAVCALYACAGAVEAGLEVNFYSGQAHWLTRCIQPGIQIKNESRPSGTVDMNQGYNEQLRVSNDRKQWYADNIALSRNLRKRHIRPLPPTVDTTPRSQPLPPEPYVLLCPFSAWRGREWPGLNWARLAHLLTREKLRVYAVGSAADKPRLEATFSKTSISWHYGHDAEWVMDAVLGAGVVVGNDSGMPHLSGLLGVPTVAVHAQMPAQTLWSHTTIHSVMPDSTCAPCRFQNERGYASVCYEGCSALGSVTPQKVFDAVMNQLAPQAK